MSAEHKRPVSGNWIYQGEFRFGHIYDRLDGMRVISSVDTIDEGHDKGPNWHVSVSKAGARCTHEEAVQVLSDFGAVGFDEDNHLPGQARHFWLNIEKHLQRTCPCKENEKPTIEGDYTYREDKQS